ncbi:MAG: hypothetical protein ACR2G5_06705 [Pyrinomonadaceae bacterium]
MNNGKVFAERAKPTTTDKSLPDKALHPAWREFVRYCAELKHGEIELLKIQDGLPVLAEVTRKKVKVAP